MNEQTQTVEVNLQPNVRSYSNIIQFIKDLFVYKKSLDSHFTLDMWSTELGFKSRSFLHMVYHGKKPITPEFVDILSKSIGLTSAEQEHLLLLSLYHRAKSSAQKSIYLGKILENLEINAINIEGRQQSQFLSSPLFLKIKLLLAFTDVKGTETELASLLNVSVKSVQKHLAELEVMGLVVSSHSEIESGKIWKTQTKSFSAPNGPNQNEAVNVFHQNTMEEAAAMIQQNELMKRFRSVFFALEEGQFPELLDDVESFLNKMKNKYACDDLGQKRLLKMNLQAYPVSERRKK